MDDFQKLPRMIALKTMRTLEFCSMDVVLLQELVNEVGALVSVLVVGKRFLDLACQLSRDSSHRMEARNVSN